MKSLIEVSGIHESLKKMIRRGYALIFAFVFILIIGMAALPPLLMSAGNEAAGTMLYRGFRLLCHQYPWRCWFLGGEQAYYPIFSSDPDKTLSIEKASGLPIEEIKPRIFFGDPKMGYQMAICQRDVAIYGAMAVFAVLFFISGYNIPRLDWKLWLIFGIIPVGVDGGSQLLTQLIPSIPFRESSPFIRTVTGVLLGFTTCWYLLPALEKNLRENNSDDCQ